MAKQYSCLDYEKRLRLRQMADAGMKPAGIAAALGVHLSTVYRELRRHSVNGVYDPAWAEKQYRSALSEKGPEPKLALSPHAAAQVAGWILEDGMSVPEAAKALNAAGLLSVTKQTLYRSIREGLIPGVSEKTLRRRETVYRGGTLHIPKWAQETLALSDGDVLVFHVDREGKLIFEKKKG